MKSPMWTEKKKKQKESMNGSHERMNKEERKSCVAIWLISLDYVMPMSHTTMLLLTLSAKKGRRECITEEGLYYIIIMCVLIHIF